MLSKQGEADRIRLQGPMLKEVKPSREETE